MTVRKVIIIPVAALLLLVACGISLTSSVRGGGDSLAPTTASASPRLRTVELATLARSWSSNWMVIGTKSEPTYVETIRISRNGDRFTFDAEANGQPFGRVEMTVDDSGQVAVLACPRGASCDLRPTGYLATVQVLAMVRRGQGFGTAPVLRYAGREIACVPANLLRANTEVDSSSAMALRAVSSPCLDVETGAVLAQRSCDDGGFVGPTLDEGTLIVHASKPETGRRSADPFLVTPAFGKSRRSSSC